MLQSYLRISGHLYRYELLLIYDCIYLLLDCKLATAFQDEDVKIPEPVDQLLSDYAKRFHEIKTPRKLLWKKNLGTVKVSHMKLFFLL